jgi:hypothetical protein
MPTTADSVVIDNSEIRAGTGSGSSYGGSIVIHANDVLLNNAVLVSNGIRQGGSINLADVGTLRSMDSTLATASLGDGGTILLGSPATRSILLQNSTLTARGFNGDGGTINIRANNQFKSTGSMLDASSLSGHGGTINVQVNRGIQFTDSTLTTSVSGGPATIGGGISLESSVVKLQNSQVLSTATEGQGGTINLTASHRVVEDAASVISATSATGPNGSVTITAPVTILNGVVEP